MKYLRGFTLIQDMIDRAILYNTQESMEINSTIDFHDVGVYSQEFPYPCFQRDK